MHHQSAPRALLWIIMPPTQPTPPTAPCRCNRWQLVHVALSASLLVFCGAALVGCQQPTQVRQATLWQAEAIPQPALPADQPATPAPPNNQPPEQLGGPTPLTMQAQPEPPPGVDVMTLEDLEQIALINNPSLARAQALVASARGNWVQVGLPPNFSWGYLGQQLGSGNIASQHAFLVDGELVTGGKLRWNRAIADQEILRAEQNMFAQQQRVLTDVRVAFFEALLAQRNLELAQTLLKIAGEATN